MPDAGLAQPARFFTLLLSLADTMASLRLPFILASALVCPGYTHNITYGNRHALVILFGYKLVILSFPRGLRL